MRTLPGMGLYPAQRQELRSVIEDHPVAPPKTPHAGAEAGPGGQTPHYRVPSPTPRRRTQSSCWSITANCGSQPGEGLWLSHT